ncbi:hypothetical protein HYY71_05645 [Candidatus Woesearchaeota archaeon]|nr:hypothetical protein [Candidatus Woesearchaeota archaeon]
MAFHLLSLILAGILSFADYVTENVFSKKLRKNQKLISFSAGAAIAYIILNLFPEIASYALIDGKKIFLYALLGFVSLNLIEQYIYKEVGKLKSASSYHKSIHVAYFFVYNFFIGMALVSFALKGLTQVLLFFIPFLLYIIVEMLPQEFEFKSGNFRIFYSLAPLFGAIAGINSIDFLDSVFGELIAFITGTLLYIVIRESLPSDEAERPVYFLIGILSYTLIILMGWNFV